MDNMIRQALGTPAEREKARRRYAYQFGDFYPTQQGGAQIREEQEPLVDVFVEETNIFIVAHLPGVDKDYIDIQATEDRVKISADAPQHKYHKEVSLPVRVDPTSSVVTYKKGVLELRLRRLIDERLAHKLNL